MQSHQPINIKYAGTDVGFFSTKFSLGTVDGDATQKILVDQFPSLAPVPTTPPVQLPGTLPYDGGFIPVDGANYWVGKSVGQLVRSSFGIRNANRNFSRTGEYKALLLGSFYYMARHHGAQHGLVIDNLVLGLPLTTVFTHSADLKAMAQGEHLIPVPGDEDRQMTVQVKRVAVLSQPQGALMTFQRKLDKQVRNQELIVADMGGGTFDWFVSEGLRPTVAACGAAEYGALSAAAAMCDVLDASYKANPKIMKLMDVAMREDAPTIELRGEQHEMSKLWGAAEAVVMSGLSQMDNQVGNTDSVKHVWLTGGGAFLLAKYMPKKFPHLTSRIQIDTDPVYSNVKGFHMLAQEMHLGGL